MVCSCAMPSNSVWLQIIFCSCVKETVLFSFLRSLLRENGRSLRFSRTFIKKNKLGDRMIKQLLNSVIAKYRDLSVSRRSSICLSRIDPLATDKSRYFAQPRPIIVNYLRKEFIRGNMYWMFLAENSEAVKQTSAAILTKMLSCDLRKILLRFADIVQQIVHRILVRVSTQSVGLKLPSAFSNYNALF